MSPLTKTIFATQILSTLALFGLIWFVQIVHYPLFLRLAPATFAAHEAEHATRTGYVAAPLMLAELVSSLLLLNQHLRPPQISSTQAILGATLVAILWASTFLIQIPLHNRLHKGHDRPTIQKTHHLELASHRSLDRPRRPYHLLDARSHNGQVTQQPGSS